MKEIDISQARLVEVNGKGAILLRDEESGRSVTFLLKEGIEQLISGLDDYKKSGALRYEVYYQIAQNTGFALEKCRISFKGEGEAYSELIYKSKEGDKKDFVVKPEFFTGIWTALVENKSIVISKEDFDEKSSFTTVLSEDGFHDEISERQIREARDMELEILIKAAIERDDLELAQRIKNEQDRRKISS